MPHIGGHEGQKREHRHRGETVPEHIARAEIAAPKIDGQDDGDRQGSRNAGKPRHQHAEPAIRAVIGEKARAVADHFEERGHGIAGQFGCVGRALRQWGDDIHRNISRVGWSQFRTEITGTVASWSPERGLWFNPMGGVLLSGWGAAAIAWGLALRAEREFRCRFKWFCCRSSSWWGSPSPSCSGWPRRVAMRWRSGKPASRISRWVSITGRPTPPRSAIASATPKVLNDSRSAALRGH